MPDTNPKNKVFNNRIGVINSEQNLIYINSALQSSIANQMAREFHKNH